MGSIGPFELAFIFLIIFVGIPLFLIFLSRSRSRKASSTAEANTVTLSEIKGHMEEAVTSALEPLEEQVEAMSRRIETMQADTTEREE